MAIEWVIKADGRIEEFDSNKLKRSLLRAGASPDLASQIVDQIQREGNEKEESSRILERARLLLEQKEFSLALRYNLKKGIMELGPAGFVFEAYLERVLQAHGYKTQRNVVLRGKCTRHEIDIIAEKGGARVVIEAKYHNKRGIKSDVKVALLQYARFLDLKEKGITEGWLVTNTKVTDQAKRYANCAGIKIIAWSYPPQGSLQELIESKGLYPITVLPHMKRSAFEALASHNILTLRDLVFSDPDFLSKRLGLSVDYLTHLKEIARA